ncbi:lycopene cyclase [Haloparvum sedimenti]|uniref:lycopene cyclase n=1 Tax=Haloparvum sedimenti TaxID=1678448 RepID=UPI000B12C9A4|nr:lycopene cyclase [Haloparvum sedimenti]
MNVSRHGAGVGAAGRALASQVHPVFMLPPLAASWFGAAVAGEFSVGLGAVHALAAFFAVYTAHVKDGYVDFHVRGEDDDHPLTARGCRLALAGASVGFLVCLTTLWLAAGPVAAAVTAPMWLIGYLHAPQLDMHTLGATMGYPAGIAVAMAGGAVVQAGSAAPATLAFAAVFLIVLTGVKVVDDEADHAYDRSIDKRTVAVVLGRVRARRLAYALLLFGCIAVLWFTVAGLFPPAAPAAAVALLAVAAVAYRAPSDLATKLLVRGTYLFLAALLVAVWFRPLSGVGLPDITVLGPYTYLATEVVFGALAFVLLYRAEALWSAARTVLALYPVAYVWDWYTLEVGVFAIVARTGYDLFGIPVEEHLFMVVVPALVIGFHETLRGVEGPTAVDAEAGTTTAHPADRDADGPDASDAVADVDD